MKNKLLAAILLANIQWVFAATFPIVHSYRSNGTGIFSNVYIVELQKGLVVVDASLTVSSGKEVKSLIDDLGKPVYAFLITHGHPDHYNGLSEITRGLSAPIYSTQGVLDVIVKYDAEKEKQWKGMFGDEWPDKRTFPNKIIKDGETLTFDNVSFTVHDLGAGESHSDSYWIMQDGQARYGFIGDLVLNKVHAYLSDGHTEQWLTHLENLTNDFANIAVLYPGHGLPGGVEMLDWQKRYIEFYIQNLKPIWSDKKITSEEKTMLTNQMKAFLNNDRLSFLIGLGAEAVAQTTIK